MTTTVHCLCGAIQFEFAGEAVETAHCHCESCRRQTSSPVATFVIVHESALRITRGQPNEYASSPGVRRSFCGTCGSPIAYRSERHPGLVDLFAGTLTDPAHLSPSLHTHADEQLPWNQQRHRFPPGSPISSDRRPAR